MSADVCICLADVKTHELYGLTEHRFVDSFAKCSAHRWNVAGLLPGWITVTSYFGVDGSTCIYSTLHPMSLTLNSNIDTSAAAGVQEVPGADPGVHAEERRVPEHHGARRPLQGDLRQRRGLRRGA